MKKQANVVCLRHRLEHSGKCPKCKVHRRDTAPWKLVRALQAHIEETQGPQPFRYRA